MRVAWDDEPLDPLAALREGDPAPFDRFVEAEAPTLIGFFRRLGASWAEAEDLTQETCLKLYRSAPRYAARERFTSYVFRIARNAWIDAGRRRAVRPEPAAGAAGEDGPELRLVDGQPSPGRQLESREDAARLTRALGRLPAGQRLVFELGAIQELPYDQIGEALSIPVGTVKSRMFNAVRRLRELLDDGEAGTGRGSVR